MRKGINFLTAFLILGLLAFLLVVGLYHTLDTVTAIETAQSSMMTEAETLQSELTQISERLETLPPSPAPTKAPTPTKALQAPTTAPVWTTYKVTAYCACTRCCGKGAQGVTASGTKVKQGRTVAADPKVLPYGTVIEIEGVGVRTVEDCGAFRGLRLDLFYNNHADALEWGVRSKRVRVISYAR